MNGADKKKMGGIALKAGFWYVISSVLVRAVSIITTPIFTSLMTTEEYGITATFSSWHTLLLTLCTFNLSYSIERAKMDYSKEYDKYIGSICQLKKHFSTDAGFICFNYRNICGNSSDLYRTTSKDT